MKMIYIDTETGGTEPSKHALLQFSGIIEIDGEEKETFDFKMAPMEGDLVEDAALAVNHRTREEIFQYPEAKGVYKQIIAMLEKYIDRYERLDKFQWVGYNARFDMDFLRAWFEKNGDKYCGSWFFFPPIDVMAVAAHILIERRAAVKNFKLETIAEEFGILPQGLLHDGIVDVRLTKALYNKLRVG